MNSVPEVTLIAKNWNYVQHGGNLCVFMRRKLRIQVAFEPSRLGKEHLHQAYELVVPVQRRRIRESEPLPESTEIDRTNKQRKQESDVS